MSGDAERPQPRRERLAFGLALLLALFHFGAARLGIDYGKHWDEHFLQGILVDSAGELDAWPRKYFYGSLYAGMGYLALAPEWLSALPRLTRAAYAAGQYQGRLEPTAEMRAIQQELVTRVQDPAFLIRARTLFAAVTSLGIVAMFLAGARLSESRFGGVVAAAALALSWELNTHARHIAIDGIGVALVALFLALLARYLRPAPGERRPERWLYAAAAVAGAATGAKFHALLLLVPGLGVVLARAERRCWLPLLGRSVGIALLLALAMNPGLLFDTVQVANDWGYTARDYWRESRPIADAYKSLGFGYHLREALLYVSGALLSPRPVLAFGLFAVACLGAVARARQDWKSTLALGLFIPLYLLVIARTGLVIVRNDLPVLPVLALFLMWGFEALWRGGAWRRGLALALCLGWAGANVAHLVSTARSVTQPWTTEEVVREVRAHVASHPDERFLVSRGLLRRAAAAGIPFEGLANVVAGFRPGVPFDAFVYQPSEFRGQAPGATRLGYFRHVFGSREVNYDYYPDWIGHGRELRAYVIGAERARSLLEALGR